VKVELEETVTVVPLENGPAWVIADRVTVKVKFHFPVSLKVSESVPEAV
jgi:hypothetical protein